jgi:hypothetical protein
MNILLPPNSLGKNGLGKNGLGKNGLGKNGLTSGRQRDKSQDATPRLAPSNKILTGMNSLLG